MDNVAGLNDATTKEMIMGVLYGITAAVLLVTAYIYYTKRFRINKLEAVDQLQFITAQYHIYQEKTQLLIDLNTEMHVKLDLLDEDENLVKNLIDKSLTVGEHIIVFDPELYDNGIYYFNLNSVSTSILKKIRIN